MKIRQGFVSNSSSCSFLIVGVDVSPYSNNHEKNPIIAVLMEKMFPCEKKTWEVFEDSWGGQYDIGDGLYAYGSDGDILYLGVQADGKWEEGITFKQVTEECKKLIKEKFDVDIPENLFKLFYGETTDG